jgi:hypothetical protein
MLSSSVCGSTILWFGSLAHCRDGCYLIFEKDHLFWWGLEIISLAWLIILLMLFVYENTIYFNILEKNLLEKKKLPQ